MRAPLILFAVVISVSCMLDDGDSDGTGFIAVNEIGQAYREAQCVHLVKCGLFPTTDACLAAQLTPWHKGAFAAAFVIDPYIDQAIRDQHITYNGNNARLCIDAFAARSCNTADKYARRMPLPCNAFFRGTRIAGDDCYVDEECVSRHCSGDSDDTNTCSLGTCVGDSQPTLSQVGQSCALTSDCVEDAYCTGAICASLSGAGVSCGGYDECASGLDCRPSPLSGRACKELPSVGGDCQFDLLCRDEGTYCDLSTNTCKQLGLPGTPCASYVQCSSYYPCNIVTVSGVCAQGPTIGDMCSSTSNRCFDAGTYCDATTSMCTTVKNDGETCNESDECASGSCDAGRCTSPVTCSGMPM